MKRMIVLCIIGIVILLLFRSCSNKHNATGETITVTLQTLNNTLYYSGIIQPLKTVVITSPADGTIVDVNFQYGEKVLAKQLLFLMSSTKFLSDYKTSLMQYIKTKNDFNTSQTQLNEAKFLHDNKLISDDDFKMKQSNFYAAQLALLQAKDSLENLIQQLDINDINLYQLTIADVDKITKAMHLKMNTQDLRIISPVNGIVLAANKTEEENKKINKGDVVKQGDVLAIIGDMSGLSVRIKVNELTINQLHVGQKVKITGIAFPQITLNGEIKQVDRQGEATSGGLPTFPVEVIAPKLSTFAQQQIHVGMSAKVEVLTEDVKQVAIPIVAVKESNGKTTVLRLNEKTNKVEETLVQTGKTTADQVEILSGLKPGDKIVLPH